jgi:hypothetical protein
VSFQERVLKNPHINKGLLTTYRITRVKGTPHTNSSHTFFISCVIGGITLFSRSTAPYPKAPRIPSANTFWGRFVLFFYSNIRVAKIGRNRKN